MATFNFELHELPPEAETLRQEVREFLRTELPKLSSDERPRTWGGHHPEFSKKLAAKGWIGMTWPKKYGGHERSFLER
jgi:acyl-CoA dehydrogenase